MIWSKVHFIKSWPWTCPKISKSHCTKRFVSSIPIPFSVHSVFQEKKILKADFAALAIMSRLNRLLNCNWASRSSKAKLKFEQNWRVSASVFLVAHFHPRNKKRTIFSPRFAIFSDRFFRSDWRSSMGYFSIQQTRFVCARRWKNSKMLSRFLKRAVAFGKSLRKCKQAEIISSMIFDANDEKEEFFDTAKIVSIKLSKISCHISSRAIANSRNLRLRGDI